MVYPTIEARKPLPDVEVLRRRYAYDPTTGILSTRYSTKMRPVGAPVGHTTPTGYLRVAIGDDNNRYLVHRIIWKLVTGQEPPEFVDHIDGDPGNNRWVNLREADAFANAQNKCGRRKSKTGVKGVSICSKTGRYVAVIYVRGENKHLGRFNDLAAAAQTYRQAEIASFGQYARGAV